MYTSIFTRIHVFYGVLIYEWVILNQPSSSNLKRSSMNIEQIEDNLSELEQQAGGSEKALKAIALARSIINTAMMVNNAMSHKPFKKTLRICRAERRRQALQRAKMGIGLFGGMMEIAIITAQPIPKFPSGGRISSASIG
jgi:hypothetical protein